MSEGALKGIRVLDFTRVLAGPFATQTLGDLGAEIIKVEHPEAPDQFRFRKPELGGVSAPFLSLNRNKKSITLDMASPMGRQVALDLMAASDVVVENYTSRVMRGHGLDYATVAPLFPRLVYCSVSAYGRTGSRADAPGYDPIIAAETGIAWLTGTDGELPNLGGVPIIDITTAQNATTAILAALIARATSGKGQFIDVSLYDSAIQSLSYLGYHYLASGGEATRHGRYVALGGPTGFFDTSDGAIMIIASSDRDFRAACAIIGRPEIADHPDYQTFDGRLRSFQRINALFAERLSTASRDHWVEQFRQAKTPAGPYLSVGEALDSDLTRERGLLSRIPHPTAGEIPNITSSLRMTADPVVPSVRAPLLGEHNEEILTGLLGYAPGRIEELAAWRAAKLICRIGAGHRKRAASTIVEAALPIGRAYSVQSMAMPKVKGAAGAP